MKVWEKIQQAFWRGIKPYREFIEIGKDVSVKLILKDKGGNEIFSKKEGLTKKEGGSFKSCSAWKGSNDLPWGKKGLPGVPGVGGNYTD